MGDSHRIETAHPLARDSFLEHAILISRIDEKRRPSATNEEGISLPDVQHDDLVLGMRHPGSERHQDEHGCQRGDQPEGQHPGAQRRPPCPQAAQHDGGEADHRHDLGVNGQAAAGHARKQVDNPPERPGGQVGDSDGRRRRGRRDEPDEHGDEPDGAGEGEQGRSRDVGNRREKGHLREQGRGIGLGGQSRGGRERQRFPYQRARPPRTAAESR